MSVTNIMCAQLFSFISIVLGLLCLVEAQRCQDEQPIQIQPMDYTHCGRPVCASNGYCYRTFPNICLLNTFNLQMVFAGQRELVQSDMVHCLPRPAWSDYNASYRPRAIAAAYAYANSYESQYPYDSQSYNPYRHYGSQEIYSPSRPSTHGGMDRYSGMQDYYTQRQVKYDPYKHQTTSTRSTTASPTTETSTAVVIIPFTPGRIQNVARAEFATPTTTARPSTTPTTLSLTNSTTISVSSPSTSTTSLTSTEPTDTTTSTTPSTTSSTTTTPNTTPSTTSTTTTTTQSTAPTLGTTLSTTPATTPTTTSTTTPSATSSSTMLTTTVAPTSPIIITTTTTPIPTEPTTVSNTSVEANARQFFASTVSSSRATIVTAVSPTSTTQQPTTTSSTLQPTTTSGTTTAVTTESISTTPTNASNDLDVNSLVSLVFTMSNGKVFRLALAEQIANPTTGNKTCAETTALELTLKGAPEPLQFTGCLFNNSTKSDTTHQSVSFKPYGYMFGFVYGSGYGHNYGYSKSQRNTPSASASASASAVVPPSWPYYYHNQ